MPSEFDLEKGKVATETLTLIDKIFTEAKATIKADRDTIEAVKQTIDESSKTISEAMVSSMKKLANLIDVELFDVLSNVFGDENAKRDEKMNFILKEATEIYDAGDSIFKNFEEVVKKMEDWCNLNFYFVTFWKHLQVQLKL